MPSPTAPTKSESIAVVGAGVSGLVAAHLLARCGDVELFERDERAGGHAHSHDIVVDRQEMTVDSGFLVYNHKTYPGFVRLLEQLGVEGAPSDMSFGVWCHRCGVAYSSRGVRGFVARPAQIMRPSHWGMVADIRRWNRAAKALLAQESENDIELGAFLERAGPFGEAFRGHYLLPMVGAIWSAAGGDVLRFSTQALLRFLENHGLLAFDEAPPWWTIPGGSRRYVRAICDALGERVHLGTPVEAIRRDDDAVHLRIRGTWRTFDRVVLATHADVAARLLVDPGPAEGAALSAFRYSTNRALLHTDRDVLPPERAAWAAWNTELRDCRDTTSAVPVSYHLNRLQSLPVDTPVCVSLNRDIREEHVLAEMEYDHPIMDTAAYDAQTKLAAISGTNRTFFAGAHLGNGFHEDGLQSGHAVAAAFGVTT